MRKKDIHKDMDHPTEGAVIISAQECVLECAVLSLQAIVCVDDNTLFSPVSPDPTLKITSRQPLSVTVCRVLLNNQGAAALLAEEEI